MKLPKISGFDEQALNKYFKNTGLLILSRIISTSIKMVINIAVANYLMPINSGILNTSVSYVFLFAGIASLGLDSFIVKELHRYPKQQDIILGTTFNLKLFGGFACIPLIYLAWLFFPLSGIPYHFVFILSLIWLFQSLSVIDSYFQSEVQSKYILYVQIFSNLISALIKIVLIIFKAKLIWFFYAYSLDILLLNIGYIFVYNRKGRNILSWKFNSLLAKKLLNLSWPLIISGLMVSVYMKIDGIMLKEILGGDLGNGASGTYSAVVMFSEPLNFVPAVIVSSLFPALLTAKRDDTQRYKRRLQNLYDLMIWISLSFAVFIGIGAPFIYKLFKPAYAEAAPVLSVHVWGSLFIFLGTANGQALIAEGFNKLIFFRTSVGAIVKVALNFILIPKLGLMGTAIATVVAYFIAGFFVLFFPKTKHHGIMMLKSLFLVTVFQKILIRRKI